MGIFSSIRNAFSRATRSTPAASDKNRNTDRSTPKTAVGRVAQNILTDIAIGAGRTEGVSSDALRDYENRTAASKKAMEELQARNQNDSGSSSAPAPPPPPAPEPEPEPDPVIEEIKPDTTIVTDPPVKLAPVTKPDPVAVKEPEKQAPTEGEGAPTEPDTGAGTTTAVGAEEEADTLEKLAEPDPENPDEKPVVGETEAKTADTIRSTGRRSTIQTTSKGLLSEAPTRRRRSLIGGGLLT